jgi:cytochrome c biogenesis protein
MPKSPKGSKTPVHHPFWWPWLRLLKQGYRLLASMELAIVLLIALAVACIIGSLMPQETLVSLANIQRQFGDATPYLKAMGFFNVFYSPWFFSLEALFFLSIVLGSFRWLRPAWRSITLKTLMNATHIQSCSTGRSLRLSPAVAPPETLATLTLALKQEGFSLTPSNPKHPWSLYAQRGWLGRVGPMITHLGIALTLLAALYGAFSQFTAQATLKPNESLYLSEADSFQTSISPPYWVGRIPEWKFKVIDFEIEFQSKAPLIPKQFTSTLQILDPLTGEVLAEGKTSVNHPFVYDGVTFYQAQFSPTTWHDVLINHVPLRLDASQTLAGRPYAVHPVDATTRLFIFPLGRFTDGLPRNRLHVLLERNGVLQGYQKGFSEANNTLVSLAEGGAATMLGGQILQYKKAVMATGLQIKSAPETPFLYVSLFILALGCALSFIPHYQVWFALYSEEGEGNSPPTELWYYTKSKKRGHALEEALTRCLAKMPRAVRDS